MITAPGPPITGFAVPASTPPSPSPTHQTPRAQGIEAASATLTVGRRAMPTARNSCTLANAALVQVGWPATRLAGDAAAPVTTLSSLITEPSSVPGQAVPLTGACTCSAACTTCGSGASIAVGPPGIGTNQTWIIGWVTLFTDPGGQVDCPGPTVPTTSCDRVRHRLVCTCHCVRQPPGWGVGPWYLVMYIAATSTAPCGVLAYTRDCGSR